MRHWQSVSHNAKQKNRSWKLVDCIGYLPASARFLKMFVFIKESKTINVQDSILFIQTAEYDKPPDIVMVYT